MPADPNADVPDSWGNPKTLPKKFDQHGSDFNALSPKDYADQAEAFRKQAITEKFPAIKYPNGGEIGIYDPSTNSFGVYTSGGKGVTYYKPTSPTYFAREAQDTVARGGRIINPLPEIEGGGGRPLGGGGMGLFERPDHLLHPIDEILPQE